MRARYVLLVLLVLSLATPVAAQTRYDWNGGTGVWTDATKWTPVGVPAATDTVVIATGTATFTANTTVAGFRLPNVGAIDGDADLTITASMVWSGGGSGFDALRGSGTVTVAPGATLLMAGPTTHYGATNGRTFVNAGTATWTGPGGWGDTGHFVNEGELVLAFDAPVPQRLCFSSEIDAISNGPAGVIRRTGTGEATIYCGFSNAGTVRIENGSIVLRGFNATGGTDSGGYEVEAGATLVFSGGNRTMTASSSISGEGAVEVQGGTTTLGGPYDVRTTRFFNVTGPGVFNLNDEATTERLEIISGTLGGSGTLTVTDTCLWEGGRMQGSGMTVIDAGISLDIGTATVSLSDSRTLRLEGATTWSGDVGINNGSSAVTLVNAGVFTSTGPGERAFFAGTFRNEGTFIHDAGTVRFSSGFENVGEVHVGGGTLRLQGFNATGGTDTGRYAVAEGGRLEFSGGNRTLTTTAEVVGTGTVTIGTFHAFTNGASWQPGTSPGTLTVESNYPAGNGVLEVELGGYAPGTEHDQLAVAGEATLGGTLRLLLTDGFVPEVGDAFTVLTADAVTGTFDAVEEPEGFTFSVAYNADSVTATVVEIALCDEGLQPDTHTLALYKFDEAVPGTTFDASGNGLHGTDEGTAVVEGRFCSARQFDGEDDRISMDVVREALQGVTAWTIEYVARSEDGGQVPELVNHNCSNGWWLAPRSSQSRYGIKTSSAGGFCAWTADEFFPGLLDTEWHYYALTWDGDALNYYRDGLLRASTSAGGTFVGSGGQTAWIGHSDGSGGAVYTAGFADDLRVSTIARSAAELCVISDALGFPCVSTAAGDEPALPRPFALHAPYPNPVRRAATLAFELPEPQRIRLAVYDVLGREVAVLVEGERPAGRHEAVLDGASLPSGVYLIRIEASGFRATQKLVHVR